MKQNYITQFILGLAVVVFTAYFFRYEPMISADGTIFLLDRLRGRVCGVEKAPTYQFGSIACNEEEFDRANESPVNNSFFKREVACRH